VRVIHRDLGLNYLKRRRAQELNEVNGPTFMTPYLSSPNCHDLSLVNYIWGIIQQLVHQAKVSK